MNRSGIWPVLSRIIGVIAALILAGVLLRLIGAILTPVLPSTFMHDLSAGWQMLYDITGPAMPAVMALIILGALIWIALGGRR